MPKFRIEEAAARKQARIDANEDVIVGVNKYQLKEEERIDVREIDNTSVRNSQIQRLNRVRATRDNKKVKSCLQALETCARDHKGNLLTLSIEAARARCTVGEISNALEKVFGRYSPSSRVVSGAYKNEFGQDQQSITNIISQMNIFEKKYGRRPRILVAKMGQDGHDRGAKVIASGFSDLGFDVDIGPLFNTPEEVVRQALDSDVHVVGVSSQAAAHKTLVPQLLSGLKKHGGGHMLVVCGGVIPHQDYQFLYDAGVTAIFGPGTKIHVAAAEILKKIDEALSKRT